MSAATALTAFILAALVSTPTPTLDDQSFARWRDTIRPSKAEVRWAEVPWRPTFWEGVVEAQKTEQPMLIWAMNGHPLACT